MISLSSASVTNTSTVPITTNSLTEKPTSTVPPTSPSMTTNSISGTPTETLTNTVSTPTLSAVSSAASGSNSNKEFFQNTGAVVGTFTVVGLVVLALLIFLTTYIMRRRRKAKFNRELDEATSEAANTSVPVFLDDDDGRGRAEGVYSDTSSHGTYAQQPISTEGYGTREIRPGVGVGMVGMGHGMGVGYGAGYDYDPAVYPHGHGHGQQAQYDTYADLTASGTNGYSTNVYADPTPALGGALSTSSRYEGQGQAQPYYPSPSSPEHQLLEAAGLGLGSSPIPSPVPIPNPTSTPNSNPRSDPADETNIQTGMPLNHSSEYGYAYESQAALHAQQHPHGTGEDAHGGYVVDGRDRDRDREYGHAGDERGSYYEAEVERPRVLKIVNE
ncbi:hypothetical protein C0995_004965 [Termitomyces sp. Mi166|nr:hypothetical protein C0995_004965 [Termitomyces sp. Mi166\